MFTSRTPLFTEHTIFGKVYKFLDWEKRFGEGETIKYVKVPLNYFYITQHKDLNGGIYYQYDLKLEYREKVLGNDWMDNGFTPTTTIEYEQNIHNLREQLNRFSNIEEL